MQPVDGQGVATGSATANGHTYMHALSLAVYFGVSPAVEYNLGRTWRHLSGTIGVRDDASTKTDAQFTIYLDGRAAKTGNLRLGLAVPADLDISDVLRLP
jgi:hypothetical protein